MNLGRSASLSAYFEAIPSFSSIQNEDKEPIMSPDEKGGGPLKMI